MSEVYVYIYDLSKGLADQLSLQFLGKHILGIWHTGIVVYGKEIYFGSNGIESCPPTGTILGQPNEKVKVGNTNIREDELNENLKKLSRNIFHASKYNLLHHNCNTFSNELSIWLTGQRIPEYVTNLPMEILETPFGQMIKPFLENSSPSVSIIHKSASNSYDQVSDQSSAISLIYYKESVRTEGGSFLSEEMSLSHPDYQTVLKELLHSINESSSYISEDIIELIRNTTSVDLIVNIAVFDVLRLFILKEVECLVMLFVDPLDWMQPILTATLNDELNDFICKFLCNLIGKHFEILSTNKEVLSLISKFGMKCLGSELSVQSASSLVRNIVHNLSTLDDEIITEIGSCLIYILSEDQIGQHEMTKENIIGSIYYLVRHSEFVKDLAKAQDINKRIRRETSFCQLLYIELQ